MAYNLPPAWDAGFALPKNVRDEGLERRAFVTKWMPRGTYDDSTDGTAGYNVPQYIKDEGTGQGAFTTFWQPRGTYNGGKVPHWLNKRPTVTGVTTLPGGGTRVTVQPAMGDVPMAEPFETYGQKAAAVLISKVASLPPGQRQMVLKSIMDRIDRSLWARTQDIFNRYVREQRMAPGDAFPLALARALSTGIAAEIITTGLRRTAPQANSLLGLGCYGCAAFLGATEFGDTWGGLPQGPITAVIGAGGPGGLLAPPPPDFWVGPFGFDTGTLVDRVWATAPASSTVANRGSMPDAIYLLPGTSGAGLPSQATQVTLVPPFLTGPFAKPTTLRADVRAVTPELLAWVKARLTEAVDSSGTTDAPVHYTDSSGVYGFPEADAKVWFDAIGIAPETLVRMHKLASLRSTVEPFARTKHIKTGANMVLHLYLAPAIFGSPLDSKNNPMVLKVWLSRVPDPSIFGALWNPMILINPLTALQAAASVAAGVAPLLGDLACDVLNHPAAGTVAGAAAAAEGLPPQAGVTGVAIAASQCGQSPPPPLIAPTSSILPWVLLGGGAIVAVALLTKPKKTP